MRLRAKNFLEEAAISHFMMTNMMFGQAASTCLIFHSFFLTSAELQEELKEQKDKYL